MDLLQYSALRFPPIRRRRRFFTTPLLSASRHYRCFAIRSITTFPFPEQDAKYHRELQAAIDVVERACRLCVDVKKSLLSTDGRILEKNDQTPVTVADFGVQALILKLLLELELLFPSIPLVAEEDSAFLRSNNLVYSVVNVVKNKASIEDNELTETDVLEAIDRGGKDTVAFGSNPATYWVLDPIDGTRGFVKGSEALYVVGLALVCEGDIVLGVMGCPNWKVDCSTKSTAEIQENIIYESGIIMAAHVGCGTWTKRFSSLLDGATKIPEIWCRCFVDGCGLVLKALFCIQDSQTWDSLPLSSLFDATTNFKCTGDKQVLLVPTCCGSLCKYLMIASGRASVYILGARAHTIIKVWDHAAGVICVQEAGGKVTDWTGNQLNLEADQVERRAIFPSGGVLATNSSLHQQILGLMSSNSSVV